MRESEQIITNSTFALNKAVDGGGIIFGSSGNDSVFFAGNTILNNQAENTGGGLLNENNNSLIELANNLIDGNQIVDSQGNIGPTSNLEGNGPFTSLGHNFISNDQASLIVPSIGDQIGDDQQPLDPMVKALDFYGGPRNRLQLDTFDIEWFLPTYATEEGSPLLYAGQAPNETSLKTDQRGYSRLVGGEDQNIDIGAYEAQRSFVQTSIESLCTEDDLYKRLQRIVLQDSTGGGFEYGLRQTLTLSLPDELIFKLASNPTVECAGSGLTNCSLSFNSKDLTIQFDRGFDSTLNSISIVGLEVRAEDEIEPDDYFLLRTGGEAQLNNLAVEDSVIYSLIYALPTFHIADQVYDDPFEDDGSFWLTDSENSIWQYGEPAGQTINSAASGSAAWMTLLADQYLANDTSWLASPCFDLRGVETPLITFNRWIDTQPGLDGLVFQQSTDRGATWNTVGDNQQVEGLGWYNSNSIVANPTNQQAGQQYGWTGREEAWSESRIILLGQDPDDLVRFRFAFASIPVVDQSISNDGFAFDDFFVGQAGLRKVLVEQFVGEEIEDSPSQLDTLIAANQSVIPIKYVIEGEEQRGDFIGADVRAFHYGIAESGFSVLQGEQYLGPTTELSESDLILALTRNPRMVIEIDTSAQPSVFIRPTRPLLTEVNVYFAIIERLENQQPVFRTFLYSPAGISFIEWDANETYDFDPTWDDSPVDPSILSEYENAELVVFVQDRISKEVYQVETSPLWSGLLDPEALREGGFAERLDPVLRIYPNPANDELNIDFGQVLADHAQIRLLDMQGRPVQKRSLNSGKAFYKVDLQNLSSGMYYLELYNTEKSIHRQKIVVRH